MRCAEQRGQSPSFLKQLEDLPERSQAFWRTLFSGIFLAEPEARQPIEWVLAQLQGHKEDLVKQLQQEAAEGEVCSVLCSVCKLYTTDASSQRLSHASLSHQRSRSHICMQ